MPSKRQFNKSFSIRLCFDSIARKQSEPAIRGVLMACAGISSSAGIFMVFLLGTFLSWRQVALTCICIPASTLFAIFFVPGNFQSNVSSNSQFWESLFSFKKLQFGWSGKVVPKTHLKPCSGFAVGSQQNLLQLNSVRCNNTLKWRLLV